MFLLLLLNENWLKNIVKAKVFNTKTFTNIDHFEQKGAYIWMCRVLHKAACPRSGMKNFINFKRWIREKYMKLKGTINKVSKIWHYLFLLNSSKGWIWTKCNGHYLIILHFQNNLLAFLFFLEGGGA